MVESSRPHIWNEYKRLENLAIPEIPPIYNFSTIGDQLARQCLRGLSHRYAVFTDIDNTLQLAGHEKTAFALATVLKQFDIPLIAITGLDRKVVHSRISDGILPAIPVLVTTGGLHISVFKERPIDDYTEDTSYSDFIRSAPNWSKEQLEQKLHELSQSHPEYKLILQRDDVGNTSPVAEDKYKVAAYFYAEDREKRTQISHIIAENFPGVLSTICSEIVHNKAVGKEEKFCLDLSVMEKLGAQLYLQKVLGITNGIAAGDSGNDFRFIALNPDLVGVIVGGYKDELKDAVDEIKVDSERNTRFRTIDAQGIRKSIYVEPDGYKGPESILQALLMTSKAQSRFGTCATEREYFGELHTSLSKIRS